MTRGAPAPAPDEAKKRALRDANDAKDAVSKATDALAALEAANRADQVAAEAAASAAMDAAVAEDAADRAKRALAVLGAAVSAESACQAASIALAGAQEAVTTAVKKMDEYQQKLLLEEEERKKAAAEELEKKRKDDEQKRVVVPPKKASAKKKADMYEKRKTGGDLDAYVDQPPPPEPEEPPQQVTPEPAAVEEEEEENAVVDNWEEDASATKETAAALPPKPSTDAPPPGMSKAATPAKKNGAGKKRMYLKAELLEIRKSLGSLTEPPPGLLPFVVEKTAQTAQPERRRLGPGGSSRASGAGAGGGGSSRDYGRDDEPRRGGPPGGMREPRGGGDRGHRGGGHDSEKGTWARGQRVKATQNDDDHGFERVSAEPLQQTAHRWDPKKLKKSGDATEKAVAAVTAILNKMTPENFDKLSAQLASLEMISSGMLERVVGTLFDKAVDEPHFAVVYAELCRKMILDEPAKSQVWPFIRCVRDDETDKWTACADVDVLDPSKPMLIPVQGDLSDATDLLRSVVKADDDVLAADEDGAPDDDDDEEDREKREGRRRKVSPTDAHLEGVVPEAVGQGQLELKPGDCVLFKDRVICLYTAPQRPGTFFCVLIDASNFFGPAIVKEGFTTKEDAETYMMKSLGFRRYLLNKCQKEFEKVAKGSGGALALAEMATEAMKEVEAATKKAKEDAVKAGLPAPIEPEPLAHGDWITKLKRRMLGIIRFIGELFKQSLLKEKIMYDCVNLLLGPYLDSPDVAAGRRPPDDVMPDDESIEAACKLFGTIGRLLESNSEVSKANLNAYFAHLKVLSRDKRLAARTRFMLQDLADVKANGWNLKNQLEGPHKIGAPALTPKQLQQQ